MRRSGIECAALALLAASTACSLPPIHVIDAGNDVIVASDATDMTTAADIADAADATDAQDAIVAVDADAVSPDVMCTPQPNCGPAIAIAARGGHSCAARAGGAVLCWGEAPLGNGTTNNSTVPVAVVGLPSTDRATRVAASNTSSCALTASGKVYCWGQNSDGECGDGEASPSPLFTAVAVVGLPAADPVVEIGMGNNHTCARTAAGDVWCWGSNGDNQVSPMLMMPAISATPIRQAFPTGGVPVAQLAVGYDHNCVIGPGASVWCWGNNATSQAGQPTSMRAVAMQTSVMLDPSFTVSYLAAGGDFTCVVDSSNVPSDVVCWGNDSSDELGYVATADGSNVVSPLDAQFVSSLGGADFVAAGGAHACAISRQVIGDVKCWGADSEGQLGDSTMNNSPVAITVRGAHATIAIAAGDQHTCAVQSDGSVLCWGSNGAGQLGNGMTMTRSTVPVPVVGFP